MSPSSGGIGPDRSLPMSLRYQTLVSLPSSDGIEPDKPVSQSDRIQRLLRLPSSGGIEPVSSFPSRY